MGRGARAADAIAGVAVAVAVGLAGAPAFAQEVRRVPAEAAPDVKIPVLVDDHGRSAAYWRQRVIAARKRVEQAREAVAAAEVRLQNARQKKRPRGEALEALQKAKAQLEEAKTELAALPEEARRAGAPPGWLRVDPEAAEAG